MDVFCHCFPVIFPWLHVNVVNSKMHRNSICTNILQFRRGEELFALSENSARIGICGDPTGAMRIWKAKNISLGPCWALSEYCRVYMEKVYSGRFCAMGVDGKNFTVYDRNSS